MPRWCVGFAVLVAVLVLGATGARAQTAQVVGTIKDQSGAVIPGATVTARNAETGLARTVVSEGNGGFRLQALPPGRYAVTVELVGFTSETQQNLALVIDQTATLNFTLRPATLEETVTVAAEVPIVDTTATTVSTSVTNEQIQDLPVASRRWVDLAMLTPGVSQDNIRGFFYRGNVNIGAGTREYSNGFVVDGVNNTWAQMGEPRQNFGMDAIREFRVSQATYKAEFGLATGGVLSVVTKSGTNEYHGSGFTFFRDKSITSRTYFERTKPDFRRYQYGGTFGGPIALNRTHFFFAYERSDENQFFTVNTGGRFPEYDRTHRSDQYRWTYSGRLDHQVTADQSAFFRASQEVEYRPIITAGGRVDPSNSFDFAVPRSSFVGGHTWIINQRMINDVRVQYAYAKYEVAPPYSHGSWESGDFGQDRLSYCTPVTNFPSLGLGGCGNSQMGPEKRLQFKNDFSWTGEMRGFHEMKAGVDFSTISFRSDSLGSPLGTYTFPRDVFYNAADPTTYPTNWTNSLPTFAEIPVKHFAVYLQDDWRLAPGVTLNVGLRYDRQVGNFNEDLDDLLGRIGKKLGSQFAQYPMPIPFHDGVDRRGDNNNFGPRVGFAWDPGNTGRTNINGGYGLFYDNRRTLQNFGELTWPQSRTITIPNPAFPDALLGQSRDQYLSKNPPNITVMDNDEVNAYAHQFNLGVSRMVGRTFGVTANWIVVRRYSDRDTIDVNLPDRTTRLRPYPQFGRVNYWQSTADNRYQALLLRVERRMSDNYQFMLSYTLSKADDRNYKTSGGGSVYGDRYGYYKEDSPGLADRRHRLVASGIVQLPWNTQVSTIADFRSSLPMNPVSSFDLNGDGYAVDLPAGVLPFSGCRGLDLNVVNAFRATRGLGPVGAVACPGFANVDVRVSKVFALGGERRLELIGQLFNIANRANFNVPSNNITAATFGQSTSLLPNINAPSRQIEFAVRFQF